MPEGMEPPEGFDGQMPEGMEPPEGFDGQMPEGAIVKYERTPLTKEQLKGVPNARSGEEILAKMKETDPDSYKEYENLRKEDPRCSSAVILLGIDG